MPASFPPSSSVTGVTPFAALAMTFLPVAIDPVKTILSMPSWLVSSAPSSSPPDTTLTRPAGNTSLNNSTIRKVLSGVNGDGLITTVFPVRMPGTMCQIAMISGQFHGVIEPTTPSGTRCCTTCRSSLSSIVFSGILRPAVYPAHAAQPPISKCAPIPPSGFPCSFDNRTASSSALSVQTLAIALHASIRSWSLEFRQAFDAADAASIAWSRCALVPTGASPTTSSVLAGLRISV